MKYVQEITFTHLKGNDARLYKENKNIKYNMIIHNGSNIYYIEELYQQKNKRVKDTIILKSIIKMSYKECKGVDCVYLEEYNIKLL